jgi:CheY-like chemotaxis protein
LKQAEIGCIHAKELAQRLLTFAKGGAPQKQRGSIGELVREAASFYARDASVSIDVPADLWLCDFDASQMNQVMHNLLVNARQAMPHGGGIRVSAANVEIANAGAPVVPGRYVCVRVIDEGVGIASENLDRIFDPYFSTKKTGSGLGLATAHSIVLRHGGHISVSSAVGRGTTFEIYVPAAEEIVTPEAPSRNTPRARVLVMDDEPLVRNLVADVLRDRGFDVEVAAKGEDVLAAFGAGTRWDLVLLDLTIKDGLGGTETLARLHAIDASVKAIMMTGYSTDLADASVREMGFMAAIWKPFGVTELEAAVNRVIAST